MKRTGLHRLDCADQCGAYVYATVANLERHNLPQCGCGARFLPVELELTLHLLPADDTDRAAVEQEFDLHVTRSARGQMRSTGAGHAIRSMGRDLRSPVELAADAIEQRRRAEAHARRVSGLRRGPHQPTPGTSSEVPF